MIETADDEVFPPSPAPSGEDYVACFNDMVGGRLLTTVSRDDAMTLEVSVFAMSVCWVAENMGVIVAA